jgi:hypothetical protein
VRSDGCKPLPFFRDNSGPFSGVTELSPSVGFEIASSLSERLVKYEAAYSPSRMASDVADIQQSRLLSSLWSFSVSTDLKKVGTPSIDCN